MTIQEAAKVIAFLRNCFTNSSIADTMPTAWAEVFEEFSGDEVMAAAKVYARSGNTFFPATGDLIKILDLNDPMSLLTPGQVWNSIRKEIGNVGTNGRPDLTPLEWEVVQSYGGWRAFCQMQIDDIQKRLPTVVEKAKQTVRQKQKLDALGSGKIRKIGA
jgi:hypothetical protein